MEEKSGGAKILGFFEISFNRTVQKNFILDLYSRLEWNGFLTFCEGLTQCANQTEGGINYFALKFVELDIVL